MNTVFTKAFSPPPIDKAEILRYAGAKEFSPEIDALLEECLDEVNGILTYKVCYGHFPVSFCKDFIDLSFIKVRSESLEKNLSGCRSIILFAATVGLELDRLISKYGRVSPSKALMLNSIGAERIESLCDVFNEYIAQEYGHTRPRFSPGYGDLSIKLQKDFFRVLQPNLKIGLTLSESMLMTPSKSVTAIIGISDTFCKNQKHSCNECQKTDCSYRRSI
ncbi:MAG: Vitamin B12 dependent methionine synthase activation subunit [Clostridia bacterium]|nr:Vitamin B12 dependent methionine synthase activation subunit [Clostridia bacterium]